MFCNYCGAQNPGDASFCSACGKAIGAARNPPQAVQSVQDAELWDRLILPAVVKQQLQSPFQTLREAVRGTSQSASLSNILLFSSAGTAKTGIVRAFANAAGVAFLAVTAADLKSQFIGQSASCVRDVFTRARAVAPAIVFIDRIDAAAAKRNAGPYDPSTAEVVNELLTQMNGLLQFHRPVMVMAATDVPDQVDDVIRSRFRMIEIPLPDEAARA
jgi:AAA+ superfamily predicted ATPase